MSSSELITSSMFDITLVACSASSMLCIWLSLVFSSWNLVNNCNSSPLSSNSLVRQTEPYGQWWSSDDDDHLLDKHEDTGHFHFARNPFPRFGQVELLSHIQWKSRIGWFGGGRSLVVLCVGRRFILRSVSITAALAQWTTHADAGGWGQRRGNDLLRELVRRRLRANTLDGHEEDHGNHTTVFSASIDSFHRGNIWAALSTTVYVCITSNDDLERISPRISWLGRDREMHL